MLPTLLISQGLRIEWILPLLGLWLQTTAQSLNFFIALIQFFVALIVPTFRLLLLKFCYWTMQLSLSWQQFVLLLSRYIVKFRQVSDWVTESMTGCRSEQVVVRLLSVRAWAFQLVLGPVPLHLLGWAEVNLVGLMTSHVCVESVISFVILVACWAKKTTQTAIRLRLISRLRDWVAREGLVSVVVVIVLHPDI